MSHHRRLAHRYSGVPQNRCIRIPPPILDFTTVALGIFLIAPERVNTSGGATHVLASYLLVPVTGKPLVQAGWTLSYEFYFYLVFAVGLAVRRPARPPARRAGQLVALVVGWHLALPSDATAWSVPDQQPAAGVRGRHRPLRRLSAAPGETPLDGVAGMLAAGVLIFVAENQSGRIGTSRARCGRSATTPAGAAGVLGPGVARAADRPPPDLAGWSAGDISYSRPHLSHVFLISACGLLLARVSLPERWGGWLLPGLLLAAASWARSLLPLDRASRAPRPPHAPRLGRAAHARASPPGPGARLNRARGLSWKRTDPSARQQGIRPAELVLDRVAEHRPGVVDLGWRRPSFASGSAPPRAGAGPGAREAAPGRRQAAGVVFRTGGRGKLYSGVTSGGLPASRSWPRPRSSARQRSDQLPHGMTLASPSVAPVARHRPAPSSTAGPCQARAR